jgi:hypothetical protein
MTYLHPESSGNGGAAEVEEEIVSTRPVPRTIRRTALRSAGSRRELHADAREEARLTRGRDAFVWRGRVLPIGLPLAAAAGMVTWRRRRSGRDAMAAVLATTVLAYLEARVEWGIRRRAYSRRRAADPVRGD